MAWTDPPTFSNGVTLTASQLNQYLRDNLNYLKGIVDGVTFSAVQLNRVTNQSFTSGAAANITWTAEAFDYGAWWSSGTTITVPSGAIPAGYTSVGLLIFGRLQWEANGTGVRRVRLYKNGVQFGSRTLGAVTGDVTDNQITEMVTVVSGDLITVEGYQTSGGALNCVEANITVARYAPAS